MDSAPGSVRCSPEANGRRSMAVSSLLNLCNAAEESMRSTVTRPDIHRTESSESERERADSAIVDDIMDASSPDSDDAAEEAEAEAQEHDGQRQGPVPARLRKKQWTAEHVRRLQQLYKQDQRWEVIAEKLGRSPVACKLKHNKELRRKAPIVMPLPREGMHSAPVVAGPPPPQHQQLVNDTLNAIAAVRQQRMDDGSTMINRVRESVDEAFSAFARQNSSPADPRSRNELASLVDHIQKQLSWEMSSALAREQQSYNDTWSAIAQLQSQPQPVIRLPPINIGMPHCY